MLSSSSLESCIRDGGSSSSGAAGEEELACDEKMVLTLSVGGGNALAMEELQLELRCIGRCACV